MKELFIILICVAIGRAIALAWPIPSAVIDMMRDDIKAARMVTVTDDMLQRESDALLRSDK